MSGIGKLISVVLLLQVVLTGSVLASVRVEDEEIVFNLTAPGAERVYVVGDFNGWNPTIDRLIDVEGRFEIRLYLLPGRYRYRFILDGASIPDPDNPTLDEDGNSVFRLVETPAGLAISIIDAEERAGEAPDELYLAAELSAETGADREALRAAVLAEGRSGDRIEARFAVGFEAGIDDDLIGGGDALFTRGAAIYRFGKGRLEAFTRDADLDLDDPASLFGRSGIHRYPLGSLCRGLLYEGRLPLGIEGTAFYAGRIDEPPGGLEEPDMPLAVTLFDAREVTDSDIIGLRLGGRIWRTRFAYLMRSDRRPYSPPWTAPGTPDARFTGYERVRVDGFTFSLEGDKSILFESELLLGESRLSSLEIDRAGESGAAPYEAEWEWQEGVRLYSGVGYAGERGGFTLAIDRTILDVDPRFGGSGESLHERAVVRCAADVRSSIGHFGARGAVERYGSNAGGELFWLRKYNFFLDGDDISVGRLPFIESSGIYEVEIFFAQPGGSGSDGEAGSSVLVDGGGRFEPFALPLVASFTERGSGGGERVREVRFSKGADLHDRVRLFADARYVSYDIEGWEGGGDFLDLFVALRACVREGSWISLGVGVNPSIFDGWLYRRTGFGRERYLVEAGLLDAYSSREELLGSIEEAERSLSEEWSITFEAFVRFW